MSLYAALPSMAAIYGREVLGTYHDRMGVLPWPEDFQKEPPGGFWARAIGYHGQKDGSSNGEDIAPDYDLTFGALQIGLDVLREERSSGDRDRAGAYAVFGRADANVDHEIGGRTVNAGDTSFDAVSLGGYWTRTGAEGWYLDGVLQATWYDVKMSSHRGVGNGDTEGWGLAASAEGGYPFALDDNGWTLEPQGQLIYQTFSFDDFDDLAAEVSYSDTDSLAGRIGGRLTRTWDAAGDGGPPEPAAVWARVNLWHEFLNNPTTTFSAFGQSVPFTGSLDDSWGEIEIGADMKARAEAWSFYGNLNYQATFDGEATAYGAEAGVKYRW